MKKVTTFSFYLILSLLFANTAFGDSTPFEEFKKLQEHYRKEAEKNPGSYIKMPYSGINVIVNKSKECEVEGVTKGLTADLAGIQPGDIITKIDGKVIKNRYQAFKIYEGKSSGDSIEVEIKRNGKLLRKHAKLETLDMPYDFYIMMELLSKEMPVRLAVVPGEMNFSHAIYPEEMNQYKEAIITKVINEIEGVFIKRYRKENNVVVVDRQMTKAILNELKFQESGLVSSESRKKIGAMLGASHLLIVNYTWIVDKSGRGYALLTRKLIEVELGKVLATVNFSNITGNAPKADDDKKKINQSSKKQKEDAAAYAFGVARAKEFYGIDDPEKLTPAQLSHIKDLGERVIAWQVKNRDLDYSWEEAYGLMKQDERLKQIGSEGLGTAAPKHDPEKGPRFIRSINAEISEIKFYEFRCKLLPLIPSFLNPSMIPPIEERNYKHTFSKNTKCIFWEMKLKYPNPNQQIDYQVEWIQYNHNGTEVMRSTLSAYILRNWTSSWITHGSYKKASAFSYGEWEIGKYRVDFYVDGEKVASETFEIY